MNLRSLLSVAIFLGMLFTGTISANADPNFEVRSLSAEFDNPGLSLALGHFNEVESITAFPGKGPGVMSGLSFSVLMVPPDCRLDVSSTTTPGHAPEPTTMLLLGTGLAGVAGFIRYRRRVKHHVKL